MQADEEPGDYISRAKAIAAGFEAMRDEAQRADRFTNCSRSELIRIAENGKDLSGQKLTSADLYALHGAWQTAFGEGLGTKTAPSGVTGGVPEPSFNEHPLLSVPDDTTLRPRDVIRLCGISPTTLKRWRRAGTFPKPLRSAPHTNHIGWPARQVKAWLRAAAS